jgi:hypothetical protein
VVPQSESEPRWWESSSTRVLSRVNGAWPVSSAFWGCGGCGDVLEELRLETSGLVDVVRDGVEGGEVLVVIHIGGIGSGRDLKAFGPAFSCALNGEAVFLRGCEASLGDGRREPGSDLGLGPVHLRAVLAGDDLVDAFLDGGEGLGGELVD